MKIDGKIVGLMLYWIGRFYRRDFPLNALRSSRIAGTIRQYPVCMRMYVQLYLQMY
jgi:hypothetical protein